jgi:peptidoglycan/xylan/chitin deacetylase (PgdA/CDA1 family)
MAAPRACGRHPPDGARTLLEALAVASAHATEVRWSGRRLWASVRSRRINLTFHGIGRTERCLEPGEELVWLDQDQFEAALDSVVGRSDVQITFDDGNASDLEHALPQLRRRGLTATFFLVAGRVGAPGFLDEEGIRALAAAGMRIGCHGMRHRPWRRLGEHALREEVVDARRLLEQVVDRPVTEAAFPFGAYDRRVLRFLRRHGYRRAFSSDRGTARPGDWIQARNTVRPANALCLAEGVLAEASPHTVLRRRAKLTAKRWR